MAGHFIVFEGGEGTGKSTQIHAIKDHLVAQGHTVLVTFEPGGTALGEAIRALLLTPNQVPMHARTEALLFAAARAQHVEQVVRPALASGHIVLCDRYWDASRAYQGVGRGLGTAVIDTLNCWATGALFPEHIFLFDIDPKEGLRRAQERNIANKQQPLDRLEQEKLEFHQKIREAYLFFARSQPELYEVIDARLPVAEITKKLLQTILTCLKASSAETSH